MKIYKENILISSNVKVCNNFFSKLVGLLGRKNIEENEAYLFYKSPQIHTFFMMFIIDVVFVDKNNKIIKLYNNLQPFRITGFFNSKFTIEFKKGTVTKFALKIGDILIIE